MYRAEPTGRLSAGMDVLLIEDNVADVRLAQGSHSLFKEADQFARSR
jgi:hypothetical protein